MSWNPPTNYDYDALTDVDVYDAKGDKIGPIDQVLTERPSGQHYLLVKGGMLGLASDYYIPQSAIEMVGQDRVVLDTTKDELQHRGYDKPPTGF